MRSLKQPASRLKVFAKYLSVGIAAVLVGWAGFRIYSDHIRRQPSPVPESIRSQAKFTIIYPKGHHIDGSSWKYLKGEQVVNFTVPNDGNPIVFTEKAVPLAYRDDEAAYSRFIGTLKPNLNFKVPLGDVAIVAFVTAGDFKPQGRTGVLKAKGTLLTAHPEEMIGDEDWLYLFNSLVTD